MNIQNLRNDYLRIIKESENTEIKDYIKQIVEEVISEIEREMETSSKAKAAYKLLKDYGYKSFGSKRNFNISFSKLTSEGDDHRVYVNRVTAAWEFGANKSLGIKIKSGTSLKELESLLKDVDSKIKEMKNVSEDISESKDNSPEVNDILKLLKTYDYRLVGSKLNKTSAAYQRGWLIPNQKYVGDFHRVYVNKNTGDWYSIPNKDIQLDTAVSGNGPDELKPILTKADSIIKTFPK